MTQVRQNRLKTFQKALNALFNKLNTLIIRLNKTRQGYARKRILKPAGYFFVRGES